MLITHELQTALAVTMVIYLIVIFAISLWSRGQIHNSEDYLVAGRRLPLSLAWATLLATWFGAGTLLAVAGEVRQEGVRAAALDPLGAGTCLLLAGLFFAAPLWRMRLMTLPDFFARRFGRRAERLSAWIMVPSYFGWIAAQFTALAEMLQMFFGIPVVWGILLVAGVGMGYTLLGGMWSVTLTDAFQIVLVLIGLVILTVRVLGGLGEGNVVAGLERVIDENPAEILAPIPTESLAAIVGWLGVFCVGALGNIPGQDLTQRIFSAKSAVVARRACLLAGGMYLLFGLMPIVLALASRLHFPGEVQGSILPLLAQEFLSTPMAVIFTLVVMSAVLSTIDSAILAPSSVIAQNLVGQGRFGQGKGLAIDRIAVVGVTACSVLVANMGESAYSLLEGAYGLTLAGLFVPLTLGLYGRVRCEAAAVAAMAVGIGLWLLHYIMVSVLGAIEAGQQVADSALSALRANLEAIPIYLVATLAALGTYLLVNRFNGRDDFQPATQATAK